MADFDFSAYQKPKKDDKSSDGFDFSAYQKPKNEDVSNQQVSQSEQDQGYPNFHGGMGSYDIKDTGHLIQDLAGGLMGSVQKGLANVADAGQWATNRFINNFQRDQGLKQTAPFNANMQQVFGLEGQGADNQKLSTNLNKLISHDPNSLASTIGGLILPTVAGGTSLLKQALSQGLGSALTGNKDETNLGGYAPSGRIASGVENALLTMLGGKGIEAGAKYGVPVASKVLGAVKDTFTPNSIKDAVMDTLSNGGKSLEEHGQQLASNIKNSYQTVKSNLSGKYNQLFANDDLGEKELYPQIDRLEQGGRAPATGGDRFYRETPNFPSEGSTEYKQALSTFNDNPNVENGHALQSELASEQRMKEREISAARAQAKTTTQMYDELESIKSSREKLLNKMHDVMGDDASLNYKGITKDWLDNVIPYHSQRNLRDIVSGKLTNPTRQQLSGIFQNPEPGDKIILSHLGDNAKNDVLFQAIGRNPDDISKSQLIRSIQDAKRNGYGSYVSDDVKQGIKSIKLSKNIAKLLPYAAGALSIPTAGYGLLRGVQHLLAGE